MGKSEDNKLMKRNALLNAAYELFTGKGVNKTSVSDIVERSGIAKGTFYLYFLDKYDLRNKLIAHKASELLLMAEEAMTQREITDLEERILFLAEYIVDYLAENKTLLGFLSKNLSWGIFKHNVIGKGEAEQKAEGDLYRFVTSIFEKSPRKYENPEMMLFMIIELVSSTIYSVILYQEPVDLPAFKPYLLRSIRQIIRDQEIL
ncbi:TetR/AcrR family transcriptional regulator [Cuneatibacter caecimuris]|uniref:TetR family transcriptional regulator n=1 Tax=Cuneatibacter caecimuris TaxID=1796618 RepID=A0A4Q7P2Z7_9FIRM|nr:TetR/AcrR family transcriptional regulator [Cuneatibacter caecimuris]RZS94007.1 TetR family transcriptional regulator [Cuneatibacter caecimuris]